MICHIQQCGGMGSYIAWEGDVGFFLCHPCAMNADALGLVIRRLDKRVS